MSPAPSRRRLPMSEPNRRCPDCDADPTDRRRFLQTVAATAAATALPVWAAPRAVAAPTPKSAAESAVKGLFESLTAEQKAKVCFAWDHKDPKRGLLRTHVSNNWNVTPQMIRSDFY